MLLAPKITLSPAPTLSYVHVTPATPYYLPAIEHTKRQVKKICSHESVVGKLVSHKDRENQKNSWQEHVAGGNKIARLNSRVLSE
jgi:hypothetical protein